MSEMKKEVQVDNRGMVLGSTMEERYRVCQLYVASKMLPKGYDTPEKAFIGIQYALELGFYEQPLTALKNIAVVNGMPSIWGELPLALAMRSGQLEKIDEYFVNEAGERLPEQCKSDDVYAAICEVKRKGFDSRRFAFTQDDRHSLGVLAIWKQFTKIMMKRKARAIALKDVFPDVLLGVAIGEYEYHKDLSTIEGEATVIVSADEQKAKNVTELFKCEENDGE